MICWLGVTDCIGYGSSGVGGEDISMVCLVVVLLHGACTAVSGGSCWESAIMKVAAVEDFGVKTGLAAGRIEVWLLPIG